MLGCHTPADEEDQGDELCDADQVDDDAYGGEAVEAEGEVGEEGEAKCCERGDEPTASEAFEMVVDAVF
jgi:hypothetical protein